MLLALSLALVGSSALAPVARLAPVRAEVRTAAAAPYLAADGHRLERPQSALSAPASWHALHAQRYERAERRMRFEQAPLHSHRVLLPEFVIVDDVPNDEDLADLRAQLVRYCPDVTVPSSDEGARSPRLRPREQLERPPRV